VCFFDQLIFDSQGLIHNVQQQGMVRKNGAKDVSIPVILSNCENQPCALPAFPS
jgi:hypothetical protein